MGRRDGRTDHDLYEQAMRWAREAEAAAAAYALRGHHEDAERQRRAAESYKRAAAEHGRKAGG